MRIIVQNPYYIFEDQQRNFNGYNYKFIEKYCDGIFLYARPWKYFQYRNKLKELGWDKKIYLTLRTANRKSDILICFNGRPYLKKNHPSARYKKIKIFHIMDFSEKTNSVNGAMVQGNVDYLMGYCQHDKYSGFFRRYFTTYIGKVIGVPFGYGERFVYRNPFGSRINKCVALGSVNPVKDPLIQKGNLWEYESYYSGHVYSHELRKAIVDYCNEWKEYIDSMLPVYPETKNNSYDAVEELNKYTMFINDASIDKFPPARTYEGIACGAVMVAENLSVFKEIGFIDNVNCILFEKGNYQEMIAKISYYMSNYEKLKKIQEHSLELSEKFTHKKVAEQLFENIEKIFNEKSMF